MAIPNNSDRRILASIRSTIEEQGNGSFLLSKQGVLFPISSFQWGHDQTWWVCLVDGFASRSTNKGTGQNPTILHSLSDVFFPTDRTLQKIFQLPCSRSTLLKAIMPFNRLMNDNQFPKQQLMEAVEDSSCVNPLFILVMNDVKNQRSATIFSKRS